MVLSFILIYFEWRDTENQQQLTPDKYLRYGFRSGTSTYVSNPAE